MDIKLKKRHWFLIATACVWIFFVTMCKSKDYTEINLHEQQEIEELHQMHNQSDSLLQEMLYNIEQRQEGYNNELDSLNHLVENEELSHQEILKLEKKIRETEKLLELEKIKKDTIVDAVVTVDVDTSDVVNVNIVEKDSVVWNIVEKDSTAWNITYDDTIIKRTVYKIDTLYYDSDDIKKIKFKKDKD